ncbi:MAG: methyltransferase domain-containing protein [bacterium]|nr:methyltransferase domain-containing protein [bacterium]
MAGAVTPIASADLRRLHPRAIDTPESIARLLSELFDRRIELSRSTNRYSEKETATIAELHDSTVVLTVRNFEDDSRNQLFLNFELSGRPYFFSAPKMGNLEVDRLSIGVPAVIYEAERRDRYRQPADLRRMDVTIDGMQARAELTDRSADGMGLRVGSEVPVSPGSHLTIKEEVHEPTSWRLFGRVRNVERHIEAGWRRIGISTSEKHWQDSLAVERPASPRRNEKMIPAGLAPQVSIDQPMRIERYKNRNGETICALLNWSGKTEGAPVVVIPPAWGRTKETLLPLAATIVATFHSAGEPVVVVRYDGVRKRGESHTEPVCKAAGAEYLRFTFSQGVHDIGATLDFVESTPEFRPSASVLVTFSVASIEGRKAMASEPERLNGWVSVVGSADAQSLTRVISGGVDFFGAIERGATFGYQELQGLLVDMDLAGTDAIENRMAFLEDSRRDFSNIQAPITWMHGRDDAWMDLERIREAMSFGDATSRRIIEVPTGHQLRTSEEALGVFQLIAAEIARMVLGREVPPALPELSWLEQRRVEERERIKTPLANVGEFWRDYVMGRDGRRGMELVTATTVCRDFMAAQVEALGLTDGQTVLDLGAGGGSFPLHLAANEASPRIRVVCVDLVTEALAATREKLGKHHLGPSVVYAACDLSTQPEGGTQFIPLPDSSVDSVLSSLVLNYLARPEHVLAEVRRILVPGGRLVVSCLKRDADTSTICVDTVSELQSGLGREQFGRDGELGLEESLQSFINDAAKLLDFEERGVFQFWSESELVAMIRASGFEVDTVVQAFGRANQAYLLSARSR